MFKAPIGFTGFSRTGKDEIIRRLIQARPDKFQRVAFADTIKSQVDELVQTHLGFSAFTENDVEKNQIRHLLEHWGDVNYDGIERMFWDTVGQVKSEGRVPLNARICRLKESKIWRESGIIIEVSRPSVHSITPWEREISEALEKEKQIDMRLINDSSTEALGRVVETLFLTENGGNYVKSLCNGYRPGSVRVSSFTREFNKFTRGSVDCDH